mmetsp:Transcript_10490/g.48161  ORF Transcript_10490/g.48161 Transcript_10490/m.48161 type:complete len:250 (-) Transcript_10490:1002-1751(-)
MRLMHAHRRVEGHVSAAAAASLHSLRHGAPVPHHPTRLRMPKVSSVHPRRGHVPTTVGTARHRVRTPGHHRPAHHVLAHRARRPARRHLPDHGGLRLHAHVLAVPRGVHPGGHRRLHHHPAARGLHDVTHVVHHVRVAVAHRHSTARTRGGLLRVVRVVSLPLPHRRLLRESAVGLLLLLLLHLLVGMVMVPVGYVTVHVPVRVTVRVPRRRRREPDAKHRRRPGGPFLLPFCPAAAAAATLRLIVGIR